MGGHSLGGACGHSKTYELSLFPLQRKLCSEGLLGRHALGMLGRTLICVISNIYRSCTKVMSSLILSLHSIIISNNSFWGNFEPIEGNYIVHNSGYANFNH